MSFKRESMPSINESDNEEEEIISDSEEISTSDYASLNRQKNATLTNTLNETRFIAEDLIDKVATLKQIQNDSNKFLENEGVDDYHSDNSEISQHNHENEIIKENTNHICEITIDKSDGDFNEELPKIEVKSESSPPTNGINESLKVNDDLQPDRFGFLKGNQYTDPNSEYYTPISIIRNRERKWQDMLKRWEDYKDRKRKKLIGRCRKGIPQSMRCKAWQYLCNSRSLENTIQERTFYKDQIKGPKRKDVSRISFRNSALAINNSDNDSISVSSFYSTVSPSIKLDYPALPLNSQHHELYENYKKCTPNQDVVEQIRKDIHRQFPNHENFMQKGGLGQESLSTILTVYSIRHPETGYCQGMAPLAAALLMVMPEEDAFWTFDKICDIYIPGYYDEGLQQIQIDAKALHVLLKKQSPQVYNYMNFNQIDPICYMIDWFMCIYIRTLPWPSVLLVMDMFLCEGKAILFKVALVLLTGAINKQKQPSKDTPDPEVLSILRNLPEEITTPKYLTDHISKLTVTKTDIKRECQNQATLMAKARQKSLSKH